MTKVGTPTFVTPEPKLAQVRRPSTCATWRTLPSAFGLHYPRLSVFSDRPDCLL